MTTDTFHRLGTG